MPTQPTIRNHLLLLGPAPSYHDPMCYVQVDKMDPNVRALTLSGFKSAVLDVCGSLPVALPSPTVGHTESVCATSPRSSVHTYTVLSLLVIDVSFRPFLIVCFLCLVSFILPFFLIAGTVQLGTASTPVRIYPLLL